MAKQLLAFGVFTALAGASQAEPRHVSSSRAAVGRAPECFEYGYDYNGYDIHQVPFVASPAACQEECAGYRGCAFWTYDSSSRACYLKSAGAFTSRVPANMMISGPKQCTFSQQCFEVGVDYYGYDIEKIEGRYVMTPMDCQKLCTGNPQCAFFSWKFSTHACYLKSASSMFGRREDSDVTSGPRTCYSQGPAPPLPSDFPVEFNEETAPPSCLESGVEYRGPNLKTSRTTSASACQRECSSLRDCRFWTWSSQNNLCYLKNAEGASTKISTSGTLDRVSGARDCIPVLPGCQYANVGVIGARLTTREASSFEVCQLHCSMLAGCTHFSHDLYTGDCTLWSSFNAYSQGSSTQGLVSGPAFCDAEEVCFEQSDYVGHNVEEHESGDVQSPAACQALCRKNADCHYWTWLRSNKGCYLKDKDALLGRTNDVTSLGRFSGPKWCTVTYGCMYINSVFTGRTYENAEVEDHKACAAACKASPYCSAWTHHTGLSMCSLFSGEASLAQMPVRGAVSGTKECVEDSGEDASCFDEGIMYNLDSIMGVADAQNADECYALCNSKRDCQRWTFKNQETCYLFSNNSPSFTFDPNSISGPVTCPDVVPRKNTHFRFVNGELGRFHVYTGGACMRKCTQTTGCRSWVFKPTEATENCSLHDETSVSQKVVDEIIEAGVLPPANMLSTSCSFRELIGSVTVRKVSDCHVECQYHPQCEGWQTKERSKNKTETSTSDEALLTCNLFRTSIPVRVHDSSAKCGTKLLPGSVPMDVRLTVDASWLARAKNANECFGLCAVDAKCNAWAFDQSARCEHSSEVREKELDEEGTISGVVERPTPDLLFHTRYELMGDSTTEQQKARFLSPFRRRLATSRFTSSHKAASVDECMVICQGDASCTAWTFKESYCTLFNRAAVPTADPNAISGRRSAQPVPWLFTLNVKFTAEPVLTLPSEGTPTPETALSCAEQAGTDQCWSYKNTQTETVCYIYDKCTDYEAAPGFVSAVETR